MMARVSFGLRGMWLPLFFQILANVIFVSDLPLPREMYVNTVLVRVTSCVWR